MTVDTSTSRMSPQRTLPLFDERAQPSSWNERMKPGEYAVHDSNFKSSSAGAGPVCVVFATLAEAEQYAHEQTSHRPGLRCRIYDHRGFGGEPVREIRGSQYRGDSELSPRFRRWAGSILFFGGLGLTALDWSKDFSLTWPATIGIRMLIPGLILLVMEALIVLHAKKKNQEDRRRFV